MIRGTTPTFTCTIKDDSVDLTQAYKVYVTIKQEVRRAVNRTVSITKTGEDLEVGEKTVSFWLTQEESLKLQLNAPAKMQINWIYHSFDGTTRRASTKLKEVVIDEQLLERVLA